ncbi:MAG: hypothetical protein K5656_07140, partial [Lachnospiraceae bacterium]|nr:hypothetical protein [Lachnospiraceae bacterium]
MSKKKINFTTKQGRIMIISLVIIIVIVGSFLGIRLNSLIVNFVEHNVASNASQMAIDVNEQLESDIREMTALAKYIEKDYSVAKRLIYSSSASDSFAKMGLLDIEGKSVCGDQLDDGMRSYAQSAFKGRNTVGYKDGIGL